MDSKFLNEIEFDSDKSILRDNIDKWFALDDNRKYKLLIKKELDYKIPLFKHNKEFYRNQIFYSKSENVIDELDLEIIFCNGNPELIDIWKYFKVMSSSASTSDDGFGCLKMMLKDKITNKYLGITEISSDIMSCATRDEFIGWTKETKFEKINIIDNKEKSRIAFLINITCCIGLQPMSYNLNIGKLLVTSIFSKEVLDYFYSIRGYYYAGVSTFGLYGKSIQYDRLKEIKYLGLTKGNGTCEIPVILYEEISDFVKKHYKEEYKRRSNMSSSKLRILQFGLRQLGYNQTEILTHGKKRGVYFGYTNSTSKDFLNGNKNTFELGTSIKPFNEIISWWKTRWANQRYMHLLNSHRLKITFELKDFTLKEKKNEYAKQYQYEKLNDEIWLKNKKKTALTYYYDNKDSILEELKINLDNYKLEDQFIYPEYLCGFFDADGSIYISKNTLFISFTQCVLNVLILIQKEFGGAIFKRNSKNNKQRDQYTLRIVGLNCKKILNVLNEGSILKINKVQYAMEFIEMINKKTTETKTNLIDLIRNNTKIDDITYFNRVNWKYIAGFFDGDGCITLNYSDLKCNRLSIMFSISQKYTPNFLKYLQIYIRDDVKNNVSLSKLQIAVCKKDALRKIYEKIKNYIIVKKFQYDTIIKILDEYSKMKNKDFEVIRKLADEVQTNKHQHIEYELNIEKTNLISNMTQNIIKYNDIKENKVLHTETTTKILQSTKKIGILNPNYGKNLESTHSLNISLATSLSKRAKNENLTDEKIREIYALKDVELQKDVAEKYKMNREMIRRIWNKTLLPTDDPEYMLKKELSISKKVSYDDNSEKSTLTNAQKTSIGKRTLSIEIYIDALLQKKEMSYPKLSTFLTQKYDKNVSVDVVKNICNGRTKLFESDFEGQSITYNEYVKLITK